MSESSTSTPWFAVSTGLFGVIMGFAIGSAGFLSPGTTSVALADVPAAPHAPAVPTPTPSAPVAPVDPSVDHVFGNPNAKVTIIEYSDIECPFCKRHHPTMKQLMATYGNDVNWVYRHFPLSSIHPNAQKSAEATECAASLKKDGFWPYLDALIDAPTLSEDVYVATAKAQGMNESAFLDCLTSNTFAQKVSDDKASGSASGVQGTPANFVINNDTDESVTIDGAAPLTNFQSAIDAILQK